MPTVEQILHALDHSNDSLYCSFVSLGEAYSYLLDTRLNLFRNGDQWAIAIERLGYNPRAGSIGLDVFYYGNCLVNLEEYNGHRTDWYGIDPILWESYLKAIVDDRLNPNAETLIVRGISLRLTHDRVVYEQAGIELIDEEAIWPEEIGRLLAHEHSGLFRATDQELYKSIPGNLKKILVLDEWHHKDYITSSITDISPDDIAATHAVNNSSLEKHSINLEDLVAMLQHDNERRVEQNRDAWENDRPSSYETWQQLATVLATGDVQLYQPTLAPNTHWRHWPESGSL